MVQSDDFFRFSHGQFSPCWHVVDSSVTRRNNLTSDCPATIGSYPVCDRGLRTKVAIQIKRNSGATQKSGRLTSGISGRLRPRIGGRLESGTGGRNHPGLGGRFPSGMGGRLTPDYARYSKTIMVWIQHGYFKHGGLSFLEDIDQNPTQQVWRSNPMGFLQMAHLLERIHFWIKGSYSYRVMVFHNQWIVLFSSALLALWSMRMALHVKIQPKHAFLLGAGSALVYQTFPMNLWYYWEIYPSAVLCLFALIFLLIEQIAIDRTSISSQLLLLRGLCIFCMVYIEPFSGILFPLSYLVVCGIFSPESIRKWNMRRTFFVPIFVALLVFALQLLWIKIQYPTVQLYGSGILFRTGLDGSTQYYSGHIDLVANRLLSYQPPFMSQSLALLTRWWFLLLAGSLSLLFLIAIYIWKLPQLKNNILLLLLSLGLYVPLAFLFSQATVIHPYAYDIYLAFPLIAALFAVLPATLEKLTKETGMFTLSAIVVGFCYSLVQIRTYAMLAFGQ